MLKRKQMILKLLRAKIDKADKELLIALASRMKTVRKIGHIKRKLGIPIKQMGRWNEVMRSRLSKAKNLGLDPDFTRLFFQQIHREALKIQKRNIGK